VEVRRAEDGTVAARSLLCTHTGCEVVWIPDRQLYHCPCHEGLFDADGRVVAGFPPRPLRDVPARIEGDEILVGEAA
jgi:Rieske Fe-S protein